MKKKISFFILTILLLIFGCKNENHSKFIKDWSNTEPHNSSSILGIDSDNTFSFNMNSCLKNISINGKWEIINDTIILNSDYNTTFYFKNEKYYLHNDSLVSKSKKTKFPFIISFESTNK